MGADPASAARCDAKGRSLGFVLTPGALPGDKSYDADAIRNEIETAGARGRYPGQEQPARTRAARPRQIPLAQSGRAPFQQNSGIGAASRYDKTKEFYFGFVAFASIKLWIPFVHVAR